jgi:hypothetical protein
MGKYTNQYPQPGTTGWDGAVEAIFDDLDSRTSAVETANVTASSGMAGVIRLSDPQWVVSGDTSHDGRLTAAMKFAQQQTRRPWIWLDTPPAAAAAWTFTQTRTTGQANGGGPYEGFKLTGTPISGAYQGGERSGGANAPTQVNLSMGTGASSWINCTATTYFCAFNNIYFNGNASTQAFHTPSTSTTMFGWSFRSLQFNSFRNVFGNETSPCYLTLADIAGPWAITTARGQQINIGGSDCALFTDGCNIGPSGSLGDGAGRYLAWFASCGKSAVGPMYFTADDAWRAIRITGDTRFGPGLNFSSLRIEGRNTTDYSPGALISMEGGAARFNDTWLSYGMGDPTVYTKLGLRQDRGLIHQTGGDLIMNGVVTDRASGVSQDSPIWFASGGKARIRDVQTCEVGGAWTALPLVQQTTAGIFKVADTTADVRLTTAA